MTNGATSTSGTGPRSDPFEKLRAMGRKPLHYLHIGKTAGTEIQRYLGQIQPIVPALALVSHPHSTRLQQLPSQDAYFFSIRDPVTRFRSGFYSRKRKGQPRIYSEWTGYEAAAFADFEHANDLAESLFSEGELGRKAFEAIKSITHTSRNQVHWFDACGGFLKLRPPLVIIRQEHFAKDMAVLQVKLGLKDPLVLPVDRVQSHLNDYSDTPPLSDQAVRNLCRWYSQDYELYKICETWIGANH